MGWVSHVLIGACLIIGLSSAQFVKDTKDPLDFDETEQKFANVFIQSVIDSHEFGKNGNTDFKEVTKTLLKAISILKQRRYVDQTQKKALMLAFCSSIAELIVEQCDAEIAIDEKTGIVTDALRKAYLATTGKPNDNLIREVKFLVGIFLALDDDDGLDEDVLDDPYGGGRFGRGRIGGGARPFVRRRGQPEFYIPVRPHAVGYENGGFPYRPHRPSRLVHPRNHHRFGPYARQPNSFSSEDQEYPPFEQDTRYRVTSGNVRGPRGQTILIEKAHDGTTTGVVTGPGDEVDRIILPEGPDSQPINIQSPGKQHPIRIVPTNTASKPNIKRGPNDQITEIDVPETPSRKPQPNQQPQKQPGPQPSQQPQIDQPIGPNQPSHTPQKQQGPQPSQQPQIDQPIGQDQTSQKPQIDQQPQPGHPNQQPQIDQQPKPKQPSQQPLIDQTPQPDQQSQQPQIDQKSQPDQPSQQPQIDQPSKQPKLDKPIQPNHKNQQNSKQPNDRRPQQHPEPQNPQQQPQPQNPEQQTKPQNPQQQQPQPQNTNPQKNKPSASMGNPSDGPNGIDKTPVSSTNGSKGTGVGPSVDSGSSGPLPSNKSPRSPDQQPQNPNQQQPQNPNQQPQPQKSNQQPTQKPKQPLPQINEPPQTPAPIAPGGTTKTIPGPQNKPLSIVTPGPGSTPGVVTDSKGDVTKIVLTKDEQSTPGNIKGPENQPVSVEQAKPGSTPGVVTDSRGEVTKVVLPSSPAQPQQKPLPNQQQPQNPNQQPQNPNQRPENPSDHLIGPNQPPQNQSQHMMSPNQQPKNPTQQMFNPNQQSPQYTGPPNQKMSGSSPNNYEPTGQFRKSSNNLFLSLPEFEMLFGQILQKGNKRIPTLIHSILRSKGHSPGSLNLREFVKNLSAVFGTMRYENNSNLRYSELYVELLMETLISALEIIRNADSSCVSAPSSLGAIPKYINAFYDILI